MPKGKFCDGSGSGSGGSGGARSAVCCIKRDRSAASLESLLSFLFPPYKDYRRFVRGTRRHNFELEV